VRGAEPRCRSCFTRRAPSARLSIDLLVEREGARRWSSTTRTDRLRGDDPAERAAHYEIQRSIYALAAAESLGADEVGSPTCSWSAPTLRRERPHRADMDAGQSRIDGRRRSDQRGEFSPAPEPKHLGLCRGCPALGRPVRPPVRAVLPDVD